MRRGRPIQDRDIALRAIQEFDARADPLPDDWRLYRGLSLIAGCGALALGVASGDVLLLVIGVVTIGLFGYLRLRLLTMRRRLARSIERTRSLHRFEH